jgi:hypothetical protein
MAPGMTRETSNVEQIDALFRSISDPNLSEGKRLVAKVRLLEFLIEVAAQIEDARESSSSVFVSAREAECHWMWDFIMEYLPKVWAAVRAQMQLEGDFRQELNEYKRHRAATAQSKGSRAAPDGPAEPRRVMMASTTGRH